METDSEVSENGGLSKLIKLIEGNVLERDVICCGKINTLPLIKLPNNTYLKYPCDEEIGASLIKLAKKAPHGRGEKTVLDKNVRDAWEIDQKQIKICTEEWNNLINQPDSALLALIKSKLVPDTPNIRAELYKLLIYEKGNHFVKHQDTQRNDRHFGSLVVFLPSVYTGGNFTISHQHFPERTFNFSLSNKDADTQQMHCNYIAFYTDCHHEIKPLESGLRVTLTYNLYSEGDTVPKPLAQTAQQMIADQIRSAFEDVKAEQSLGVFLTHQYSIRTAQPNLLKGKDIDLWNAFSGLDKVQYELTVKPVQVSFTGSAGEEEYANGALGQLQEALDEGYEVDVVVSAVNPDAKPADTKKRSYMSMYGYSTLDKNSILSKFEADTPESQSGSVVFINPDSLIKRLDQLKADHSYGTPTGNEGTRFDLQYTLAAIIVRRRTQAEIADEKKQPARKKAKK